MNIFLLQLTRFHQGPESLSLQMNSSGGQPVSLSPPGGQHPCSGHCQQRPPWAWWHFPDQPVASFLLSDTTQPLAPLLPLNAPIPSAQIGMELGSCPAAGDCWIESVFAALTNVPSLVVERPLRCLALAEGQQMSLSFLFFLQTRDCSRPWS